jgi:NADH dehydrogenase
MPAAFEFDVLVLGGGFAGIACARRLTRRLGPPLRVGLVARENHFVFQPLLPEVVGASLEPTHVVSPLRQLLPRAAILRGEVAAIELPQDARPARVQLRPDEHGTIVDASAADLVLALGNEVDVARIPGMAEHALLIKTVADALQIRHRILEQLERAALESDPALRAARLAFAVVGAGFSGIETAAEMHDLLAAARRFYPVLAGTPHRVTCIEAGPRILPELDPRLAAYAHRLLERRGLELRLDTKVRAVSGEQVHLASGDQVAAQTVVCTIGSAPHPVLRELGLPQERGRLRVDPDLRVPGRPHVYAIGDCASVPDGHGAISPPTAQFATRQGKRAARNLEAVRAGRAPAPFRHRSLGQLASLGHYRAVAALFGLRSSGFLAWWLWRTVYLLKLPRLDRKLRVVVDWTLRLFFPRDLTVVGLQRTRALTSIHLEPGDVLFRQGDPSAAFYVVAAGEIELTRSEDERVVLRERLGAGDHLGEGSLLGGRRRQTTAVALGPARVLAFPARNFDQLVGAFRALRELLERTARRFRPAGELVPAGDPNPALDRPVRECMTPDPFTLPLDATLADALTLSRAQRISTFPLIDAGGRLAALFTRADLYRALASGLQPGAPIRPLATTSPRTITGDESSRTALERMRRFGIEHLVVVDRAGTLEGILALRDVVERNKSAAR